jgi:hypothetical protein
MVSHPEVEQEAESKRKNQPKMGRFHPVGEAGPTAIPGESLWLLKFLNAAQLAKLQKVDSPTIANVIELFDVRSHVAGYTNLTLKAIYPKLPSAVGYAVTATFRAAYSAESGDYEGMPQLIADAMATPVPRIVVFQDLDDPPRAATFGE